jgi:hypothetical protein
MRELHWSEVKIDVKESKSLYFQQMEVFCEAIARKRREKEQHVHINEIQHSYEGTELKKN